MKARHYFTGILLIALVIALIILRPLTGNSVSDTGDINEFTVKAFRFGYEPSVINVNLGDKVKIVINNTDTMHGIRIPDLGIKGNETLEFTANKTGEFIWYCTNMCGEGHKAMQGKLIVK